MKDEGGRMKGGLFHLVEAARDIAPWRDGPTYVLNFMDSEKEIGSIKLVPKPNGTVRAPQAPRYTSFAQLMKATNHDEAF